MDAFEEFQGAYFSACESVGVRPLKTVLWQARVAADASRAAAGRAEATTEAMGRQDVDIVSDYGWAGAGPGISDASDFAALASATGKGIPAERTLRLTPSTVPRLELLDLRAVLLALLSSAAQQSGRVFGRWVIRFEKRTRDSISISLRARDSPRDHYRGDGGTRGCRGECACPGSSSMAHLSTPRPRRRRRPQFLEAKAERRDLDGPWMTP